MKCSSDEKIQYGFPKGSTNANRIPCSPLVQFHTHYFTRWSIALCTYRWGKIGFIIPPAIYYYYYYYPTPSSSVEKLFRFNADDGRARALNSTVHYANANQYEGNNIILPHQPSLSVDERKRYDTPFTSLRSNALLDECVTERTHLQQALHLNRKQFLDNVALFCE